MGKVFNHPTPTVINTELVPLDESFYIAADGQTEQWYYDNEAKYAPNRHLTPLILTPKLSVKDKDTNISYSVDAGTVSFYTVQWYALEYANGSYVETAITNLTDSSDADYVLSGSNLIVKKNVSYSHGVTIRCLATYKDPRDANTTCTTQGTVLLTTNRDAKVELPEVTIISPSARAFNPLTDYKTVDGVEVQDSLFDFEATVSNKPTGDSVIQYRVDGGGTEELVEEDGVMTALPSMDIRYPDSDVMLDQSFLYRITANGTKPNVSGMAFLTALRGNTVKWFVRTLFETNEFKAETTNVTASSETIGSYKRWNIVLNNTNGSGYQYSIRSSGTFNYSGHILYVRWFVKTTFQLKGRLVFGNTYNCTDYTPNDGQFHAVSFLFKSDTEGRVFRPCFGSPTYNEGEETNYFSLERLNLIDLTFIFGTDAQIAAALGITEADITTATGVAAFESWLAQNVGQRDYYAYNVGSLVPTRFEAIKTTGDDWESTTPLAIASITGKLNGTGESVTVFPDGMKRAGNVCDEIKVENGVLKAIKRLESADMGAFSWTPHEDMTVPRFNSQQKLNSASSNLNALLVGYECSNSPIMNTAEDMTFKIYTDKYIYLHNFSVHNNADLRSALQGKVLYYQLATPQEYVLDPIQEPFIFEWFGISGNQEVKADTLPWYVSGQGTSRLTVDAMFGEHINVVAAAKMLNGQISPSRAYAAVTWRIPDVDTNVMSAKGGTVRNESDSFTFETICNVKGQMLSENVKNEHLRFNWKYRKSDSTTENDAGWGQSVILSSANLINVRTVAGKLPSTHVYPYPFLLGAWTPASGILPAGYTQLDYIETTGTQYIDTGYVVTGLDNDIYADITFLGYTDSTNYIFWFGAYSAETRLAYRIIRSVKSDTSVLLYNGSKANGGSTSFNVSINTRYSIALLHNNTYFINGAAGNLNYVSASANTATMKLCSASAKMKMKVHSFRLVKNGNTAIDLIPAMRDSDNEVGMYDLVGNTFLTNAGTGDFLYRKRLPYGYTELEYLESTGTQYLTLGISGNMSFQIDAQGTVLAESNTVLICSTTSGDVGTWFGTASNGKWGTGGTTSGTYASVNCTTKATLLLTFNSNGNSGTVNGASYNRSYTCTQGTWSLFSTGNGSYAFKGKVWGLVALQNNNKVMDLVPAMRNSDRTVGMYDLVSDTFLTNAGTGKFKYEIKPTNNPPTLVKDGVIYTRTIN